MKKAKAIPHVQKQSDCAAKLYSLTGHKQFYRMPTSDKVTLGPLHDFIKKYRQNKVIPIPHCLSHSSVVRRHHDQGNSYKRKNLTVDLLKVSEISHYHRGREYGGTQTGVVLEK